MAGEKQMVPGFNHNVKHKGTPYHVQTEDSGIDNPRIITHLFVGGNVIASKKTSYADIVGAENLAQVVRELMEEQHKEMLRNLISGVYDDTDQDVAAKACAFQPGQIGVRGERAAPPASSRAAPEPVRAAPRPPEAAKPTDAQRAAVAKTAPRPPPIPRSAAPPNATPHAGATAHAAQRRPPPPATTAARSVRSAPAQRPAPAMAVQAGGPPPPRRDGIDALFGEDLISEKSLDEVILSYLAEDLAEKT